MKVALFRAFPDPYRLSMTVYADELLRALKRSATADSFEGFLPRPVSLSPPARYWSQYVRYPMQSIRAQGDVNHIADHAYGHLAWTLDPRRTLVTVHDMIALKTRPGPAQRFNLGGICRAARVICDSEATRREFLRLSAYPAERVEVIYAGVGEEFFQNPEEDPCKRLGIPRGHYILHISHTKPYKNIPGLLRIFSILIRQMKLDLRLLRAGGPFTPEQDRLARNLGINDRILHLGHLPSDRLVDLYRCAEALLFPSLDEGFGFPLLEAMASGLPVIASNRGALPEIAGDAALLADPADESAMAQRVRDLLKDANLQAQLRESGRRRARQFTWGKTARKTLDLYRKVHQESLSR